MNTFINKGLLIIASASLLLISACSDVLDVRNEGQLSTEAALSDARSVNVAMSGIYSSLQGTLGSGIPASPTEALAGDIVYAGSDYGILLACSISITSIYNLKAKLKASYHIIVLSWNVLLDRLYYILRMTYFILY